MLPGPKYRDLVLRVLALYPTCEMCGKRPSACCHHVVSRRAGGDDVEANLAALCGSGTTGCHGEVEHSRAARALLRPKLRAETITYVVERKGEAWLDVRYPLDSLADPC